MPPNNIANTSIMPMPMPPWRRPPIERPRGVVAGAMIDAGATVQEARAAQALKSRFETLGELTGSGSVQNAFKQLRAQVFELTNGGKVLRGDAKQRANDILVQVMSKLGTIDTLRQLTKTGLKTLGLSDVDAAAFRAAVKNVEGMANWNSPAQELARTHKLNVTQVTWEDTGRSLGSSVGPNITDFNIAVSVKDAKTGKVASHRMPIIRRDNVEDVTADKPAKDITINVGNASGAPLQKMDLEAILKAPWKLMSDPSKWPLKRGGKNVGLFLAGVDDKNILVSSQAAFLPVPKNGGKVEYTPQAYNYQSFFHKEHGPQPHVLTIMVTREGASLAIAGKKDEKKFGFFGGSYGEPLWFNKNGKKAPLSAERASTSNVAGAGQTSGNTAAAADEADRVLIIQIPLKPEHERPRRNMPMFALASAGGPALERSAPSDVELAVVSAGRARGKFDETMGEGWKRDDRFPVRVTIQHTYATSNGVITEAQMKTVAKRLEQDYKDARRTGSLPFPDGVNTLPVILPLTASSG